MAGPWLWDVADPADTDQIGLGSAVIRTMKSTLEDALDDEHNFPGCTPDHPTKCTHKDIIVDNNSAACYIELHSTTAAARYRFLDTGTQLILQHWDTVSGTWTADQIWYLDTGVMKMVADLNLMGVRLEGLLRDAVDLPTLAELGVDGVGLGIDGGNPVLVLNVNGTRYKIALTLAP